MKREISLFEAWVRLKWQNDFFDRIFFSLSVSLLLNEAAAEAAAISVMEQCVNMGK